jgi:general secretion pathway protein C
MASRLLTFVVWALVAISGLFWGLKLFVRAQGLPATAQAATVAAPQGGSLTRVLGTVAVADDEEEDAGDGHFQLLGIVAPGGTSSDSPQGVALISVGGQPARPWRTGTVIEGDTVLLSVSKRSVELGPKGGPASSSLSLPDPNSAPRPAVPNAVSVHTPRVTLPARPQPLGQGLRQEPPGQAAPQVPQDNPEEE